ALLPRCEHRKKWRLRFARTAVQEQHCRADTVAAANRKPLVDPTDGREASLVDPLAPGPTVFRKQHWRRGDETNCVTARETCVQFEVPTRSAGCHPCGAEWPRINREITRLEARLRLSQLRRAEDVALSAALVRETRKDIQNSTRVSWRARRDSNSR